MGPPEFFESRFRFISNMIFGYCKECHARATFHEQMYRVVCRDTYKNQTPKHRPFPFTLVQLAKAKLSQGKTMEQIEAIPNLPEKLKKEIGQEVLKPWVPLHTQEAYLCSHERKKTDKLMDLFLSNQHL